MRALQKWGGRVRVSLLKTEHSDLVLELKAVWELLVDTHQVRDEHLYSLGPIDRGICFLESCIHGTGKRHYSHDDREKKGIWQASRRRDGSEGFSTFDNKHIDSDFKVS